VFRPTSRPDQEKEKKAVVRASLSVARKREKENKTYDHFTHASVKKKKGKRPLCKLRAPVKKKGSRMDPCSFFNKGRKGRKDGAHLP